MPAPKLPCFDYQALAAGKEKGFGLTPAEIRPIWEYARKRYLDNGVSFEDTITALSRETGNSPRFFEEVMTGPKTIPRIKTKEMFLAEDARRSAKWKAQQMIDRADTSMIGKIVKTAEEFPRASLTAFHGGVFPVTHAGGLMLVPSAWGSFIKGAAVSWGSAKVPYLWDGKAFYEQARLNLIAEPRYAKWRSAGLRIGMDDRPKGILSNWMTQSPNWSMRSWLGVERIRMNYANEMFDHLPKNLAPKTPMEELSVMKGLAEIANHATGVTNLPFLGPVLSKGVFAPQLLGSKVMRVTHDPYETALTAYKMLRGQPVSAGERAAMYMRTRNAGEMIATWNAGLMLNNALLEHFGSDQRINFGNTPEDRGKSDLLRFKTGIGDVLASRGPEEYLRLLAAMTAIGHLSRRELHGHDPRDEVMDRIQRFALYKIAPGFDTGLELGTGTDLFSRPLPDIIQSARHALTGGYLQPVEERPGKPKYTNVEYAMSHAPIFLVGPSADMYDDMREKGLSHPSAMGIFHAAFLTMLEFMGQGAYREPKEYFRPGKREAL